MVCLSYMHVIHEISTECVLLLKNVFSCCVCLTCMSDMISRRELLSSLSLSLSLFHSFFLSLSLSLSLSLPPSFPPLSLCLKNSCVTIECGSLPYSVYTDLFWNVTHDPILRQRPQGSSVEHFQGECVTIECVLLL